MSASLIFFMIASGMFGDPVKPLMAWSIVIETPGSSAMMVFAAEVKAFWMKLLVDGKSDCHE